MANDLTGNPLKIDTADPGAIITTDIKISKIRWVGATTAGHQAVVHDQNSNLFWESICPGDNYVEESDFTTTNQNKRTIHGLIVPTLGSGKLYIYE